LKGSLTLDDLYVEDSVDISEACATPRESDIKGRDDRVVCRAILDVVAEDNDAVMTKDLFEVTIPSHCVELVYEKLKEKISVELIEGTKLRIKGCNICEVFDYLYKDAKIYKKGSYNYFRWMAYDVKECDAAPAFRFVKTLPDAVMPKKNKASDSGFDMVLVKKLKEVGKVVYYDTGIQLAPPVGWYFDLVGRSSISKTGYMLANNIGIIDQSYRGNVMVALVKIDPDAPELELPARLVQIIPRKVGHMQAIECDDLENTARGAGGFGSSG
jgi:hypothetical protein